MPQIRATKPYANFVKGFITEANPLAFPEGSFSDALNMELTRQGNLYRRRGLEELTGTISTLTGCTKNIEDLYLWESPVNRTGSLVLLLVMATNCEDLKLHALDPDDDYSLVNTVDLTQYVTDDEEFFEYPAYGAEGSGDFFICSRFLSPVRVTVNGSGNIEASEIVLRIRDFVGKDDGLNIDEHPASLSDDHQYNLRNQGWPEQHIAISDTAPIGYPSNNEVWQFGKNDSGTFSWAQLRKTEFGSSKAARGKYIFTPYYGRDFASFDPDGYEFAWDTSLVRYESAPTVWTDVNDTAALDTAASGGTTLEVKVFFPDSADVSGTIPSPKVKLSATTLYYMVGVGDFNEITIDGDYNATYEGVENISGTDYDVFKMDVQPSYVDTALVTAPTVDLGTGKYYRTPDLEDQIFTERPTTVGFFSGRAWFGGIPNNSDYGTYIFYSQILNEATEAGSCFQRQDPTAEYFNEVLDNDGGYIPIPDTGLVIDFITSDTGLYIMAERGVWFISGGGDSGFTAKAFRVDKITDNGAINGRSSVLTDIGIIYWSDSGINLIANAEGGGKTINSLTEDTIQTFYNDISEASKETVRVSYDPRARVVEWVYDDTYSLKLDVLTGGFTKHEYGVGVLGATPVEKVDDITKHYLIKRPDGDDTDYIFCATTDRTFEDDGNSTSAYFVSAPDVNGDLQRNKWAVHLTSYFERTETAYVPEGDTLVLDYPSSAWCQFQWDWSGSDMSGRWSNPQKAYRHTRFPLPSDGDLSFDTGHTLVTTKLKARGRGKSLTVKFYPEDDEDMRLLGYSIDYTANPV